MKTKEEILYEKEGNIGIDKCLVSPLYKQEVIYPAMDEYASLRESKWRELYEVWNKWINMISYYVYIEPDKKKKGEELRQKISVLELELGLTK